jgi:S1-C subfamily serine protease
MLLSETYEAVLPSVVAFASQRTVSRQSKFPEIIGTGFVVDGRGLVATDRQVVEALRALPLHPRTGQSTALAIVWSAVEGKTGRQYTSLFISIKRHIVLEAFKSSGPFHEETVPDLAFVQLNLSALPPMKLSSEPNTLRVGMPIATAGFPLGADALHVYGKITQITPILRHGIVSSLYPFPCPNPHRFTIDTMSQAGVSGSPIFLTDSPTIVGMIHTAFPGTNISISIPSPIIEWGLHQALKSQPLDLAGVPSLEERLVEANA